MNSSRTLSLSVVALALAAGAPATAAEPDTYPPHPDSLEQPGVPKGEVLTFVFANSQIFPGTRRDVSVYVPRQYSGETAACLYVNQDGVQYNAPVVFDNLIAKGDMPVTIGVFVRPGQVPSADGEAAWDRFNRSFEYDGLGDNYVRFLLEELLPHVETRRTSDGRALRISPRAADRAIGGQSSGAIAAFTAAWERPDAFSRVFSSIGTFVGLRGGDRYPTLIRKYEPKPLRVFLQDGSNDHNIYGGDWWMANQTMERALAFAGYEVNHVWGEGAHNGRHAAAIFPDALRWLWSGWPAAPSAGTSRNAHLTAILAPGEGWQLVSEGYRLTEGPVANARGEVFFTDIPNHRAFKIALDGTVTQVRADCRSNNGQAIGPDGRLYVVVAGEEQIIAYDASGGGAGTTIAEGIRGNDLVVAHNGNIYATNPPAGNSNEPSKVWLIKPDGTKTVVDSGLRYANGVTLSPDQTLLYVSDYRSHWVYSYRVQPDGTLAHKQRFHHLHEPDAVDQTSADGMCVDRDGRLYVATNLGVQVCDQLGRVNAILPLPNGPVTNLRFGGENFDTLFVTCGRNVFKRRLAVRGANPWEAPNKTSQPRL